jgi:SAM-dependent methyltransferase
MNKWILKALVQKAISFLPFKHRINFFFQKYITKGVRLTEDYFFIKLDTYLHHTAYYRKYIGSTNQIDLLEIGTGWYAIVPIAGFLEGCGRFVTVDISPLMNPERLHTSVSMYLQLHREGRLPKQLQIQPDRLQQLTDLAPHIIQQPLSKSLAQLRMKYIVGDARSLPLDDQSVDLIVSNNTFEHIYPQILLDILKEFKRIVRPTGMMSHFIDMTDHFAHLDSTINVYHFLRFTERQWKWIDNSIQPQNRMRINEYRKLYQKAGVPITEEENTGGQPEDLENIELQAPFADWPQEEVLIYHSYVVSNMADTTKK